MTRRQPRTPGRPTRASIVRAAAEHEWRQRERAADLSRSSVRGARAACRHERATSRETPDGTAHGCPACGLRWIDRACGVIHPTLGPCVVRGVHGDALRPHRYAD